MQKLIAKYGLAAHLALMAVAPLFLFPFLEDALIARVLHWLTLAAGLWFLLAPSLHMDETLHGARRRVFRAVARDPLFIAFLVLACLAFVSAVNGGVAPTYDAETAKWVMSSATVAYLPGSVDGFGRLPFAAMVAALVLVMGCRHSLGRSARMAFLLLSSVLAGLAAVLALALLSSGNEQVRLVAAGERIGCSSVGLAFGLYLLSGTVAVVGAFERMWRWMMPLFAFAIGGTAAGVFVFATPFVTALCACVEIPLLIFAFVFACRKFRAAGEFKMLVLIGASLVLGVMAVLSLMPKDLLDRNLEVFIKRSFVTADFLKLRAVLSSIAIKTWFSHLWIGTGLGSFALDFRFCATPEDWVLLPRGALAVPNGWLNVLTERGILGIVSLLLPVGFLLVSYVVRLIRWIPLKTIPHPACALPLLASAVIVASGFFDCSFLRMDVLIVWWAFFAIAQNSFPVRKVDRNG